MLQSRDAVVIGISLTFIIICPLTSLLPPEGGMGDKMMEPGGVEDASVPPQCLPSLLRAPLIGLFLPLAEGSFARDH